MGIILLRTIVLYVVIVFALRVMGKRQLGELQPSELVVTILVSNIATLSIEDANVPLLGSILPIFTLVACEVAASVISLKSNRMRKFITGNPLIIIRDGVIDQKVMKDLRWSIDDLMEQLRGYSVFDVGEINCAIVETSGSLSIYKKFESREATAGMMNLDIGNGCESPPMTIISDGQLVADALRFCNLKPEWVEKTLSEKNLAVSDVFFMSCNRRGQYYIAERQKKAGKNHS